ncbi:redoxin family protein [Pedobacter petrophilus]|uniref:Redoxin family protein n=1 Tax=Pedobacter petrophilus TaxID=1908241 RepID=A0A7K0FSW7_9SPHI|nr:TlpA disulfide reductase family protein [Pedobacter petrophilus]MRX74708.1 redoxin family protein [Pedobacter petrophilus]
MKKTTVLIVVAVLCLFFGAHAQQKMIKPKQTMAIKALTIGDKIPEILFTKLINSKDEQFSTTALFGKAIIIDFWATWCTSCISGFPHLEELQKKYLKNLKIILVDNSDRDNPEKIREFIQRRKENGYQTTIPTVFNEASLDLLFPHRSIPHYILIGPDGRVKAITGSEGITEQNVKSLMAGLDLELKLKEG